MSNPDKSPIWPARTYNPYGTVQDEGAVQVAAFYDVNGDGEKELVCNVGSQTRILAFDKRGNFIWQANEYNDKDNRAYNPKLVTGSIISTDTLFYANRATEVIVAIDVSDGTKLWEKSVPDIVAMEMSDVGLVYGADGSNSGNEEVGILNYSDGSSYSADWPVTYDQHAQTLGAADLDGDGQDEFILSKKSGEIQVRNRDATIKHSQNIGTAHHDFVLVHDFDGDGGKEYLFADLNTSEGDTLHLAQPDGTIQNTYQLPAGNPAVAPADYYPDRDGIEIAWSSELDGKMGMVSGDLSEVLWEQDTYFDGSGGQTAYGDIDGDGEIEISVNTDEDASGGFELYDRDGVLIHVQTGMGWGKTMNPRVRNTSIDFKRYRDIDSDGIEEFIPAYNPGTDTAGIDTVFVLKYRDDW